MNVEHETFFLTDLSEDNRINIEQKLDAGLRSELVHNVNEKVETISNICIIEK